STLSTGMLTPSPPVNLFRRVMRCGAVGIDKKGFRRRMGLSITAMAVPSVPTKSRLDPSIRTNIYKALEIRGGDRPSFQKAMWGINNGCEQGQGRVLPR
ncbi:MAG: hypothetical protein AAFW98_17540, partial [Pseudomonadota bacterium]